jgi:DNA-binding IclR family transcriptional regulator
MSTSVTAPSPQLSKSVIGFLRSYVDHIEKLKLLLVLHRAAQGTISVHVAARQLDLTRRQVRDMADELADDGLVRVSGNELELAPTSIDDRLAIADLATSYDQHRHLLLDTLRELGRAS